MTYPFYKREIPKKVIKKVRDAEKAPLVSVIIPTLPSRKMELERAIRSVKKQTYPNIEIIVESGGRNVQDARNIAVRKSKGKYIAFLDDDDEFYPTKIKKQVEVMEYNPRITLCITWGDDYKFDLYHLIKPKEWWTFEELLAGFNISCTSAFMCRKKDFYTVGEMDTELEDAHEYDLAIRLSEVGLVYCIQESLTRFNQSEENWSDDFGKKITGMIQFVSKWGEYFDKKRWFNTVVCFTLFTIGLAYGKPVNKIFNMTKDKMERIGTLENPTLLERMII